MRGLILFTLFTCSLLANITATYESSNDDAERLMPELFNKVNSVSLSPMPNESKALYQLAHNSNTVMSLCYSTTLENIQKHTKSDKLSKYLLVTPVLKGEVHLIVNINSRFKTIYDLERHNVGMGVVDSATNLIAQSIFLDANVPVSEYHYSLNESMRRLIGGGLDAVVALGKAPIDLLGSYQGKFRLLNVPSTSYHRATTIDGSKYGLATNTSTLASDLVLISKKEAVDKYSLNTIFSKVTRNLLYANGTDVNSICSDNGNYGLSVSPTLNSACTQYQNEQLSSGSKKVVMTLDLLRHADSLDAVEIYSDALLKNRTVGGLSSETEVAKIKQVYNFYREAKGSKLMIKSYVNSNENDAYENAQYIFKTLRKMGISRSDMIIKSFNESTFCKNPQKPYCSFLNRKITFEFLN